MAVNAVAAPRLGFMYRLEVSNAAFGSLNEKFVENVQIPTPALETIEHASGGQGYNEKTAGGYSIDDITFDMMLPANDEERWAWDALLAAANPVDGTLGSPADYMFSMTISHLNGAGDVLETYICNECWVKTFSFGKNDALDKASKMMLSLTISCNYLTRV